jgi:SAM-dependent methyltransferase
MLGRAYRRIADRLGLLLEQRDELTPPAWMFSDPDRLDGSHDLREFISVGDATVAWFIEEGLAPAHRVLDVGCGIGRMALPLTKHLARGGTYDGIEIAPWKVRYCRSSIGKRWRNFRFHHADVFNKYYNPDGRLAASAYAFPFSDESFDFAFLVSVFTHMLPDDLEHYLSEIGRVLKRGAKCIASFWLTDAKRGTPYYDYSAVCEIANRQEPEHGVFYLERHVLALYTRYGFDRVTVKHGSWIARPDSCTAHRQDIVVAVKNGHA